MIPVYVINLARSPERRAFMQAALARTGVAPRFVDAVDGRACRQAPARLSRSEAALILSHRKLWRRLLASADDFAVALEDDAHIGEGFAELLCADFASLRFDAVKLETMDEPIWISRRGRPFAGRALHELGAQHFGTAGYLVSRQGAAKMLRLTRALAEPLDHTLFGRRAVFERKLRVLQLVPAVVVQDVRHPDPQQRRDLSTTLGEADTRRLAEAATRRKPTGVPRLAREAQRLRQQMREALRFWPSMHRVRVAWR